MGAIPWDLVEGELLDDRAYGDSTVDGHAGLVCSSPGGARRDLAKASDPGAQKLLAMHAHGLIALSAGLRSSNRPRVGHGPPSARSRRNTIRRIYKRVHVDVSKKFERAGLIRHASSAMLEGLLWVLATQSRLHSVCS